MAMTIEQDGDISRGALHELQRTLTEPTTIRFSLFGNDYEMDVWVDEWFADDGTPHSRDLLRGNVTHVEGGERQTVAGPHEDVRWDSSFDDFHLSSRPLVSALLKETCEAARQRVVQDGGGVSIEPSSR